MYFFLLLFDRNRKKSGRQWPLLFFFFFSNKGLFRQALLLRFVPWAYEKRLSINDSLIYFRIQIFLRNDFTGRFLKVCWRGPMFSLNILATRAPRFVGDHQRTLWQPGIRKCDIYYPYVRWLSFVHIFFL